MGKRQLGKNTLVGLGVRIGNLPFCAYWDWYGCSLKSRAVGARCRRNIPEPEDKQGLRFIDLTQIL